MDAQQTRGTVSSLLRPPLKAPPGVAPGEPSKVIVDLEAVRSASLKLSLGNMFSGRPPSYCRSFRRDQKSTVE